MFSPFPYLTFFGCFLFSCFLGTGPIKATTTPTVPQAEDSIESIKEHFFTPLDSQPDVKSFSKIHSLFSIGNDEIRKMLPTWNTGIKDEFQKENNFEKRPDSSMAISTSSLTWEDVAELLNYAAKESGEKSTLYTAEVKKHITCTKSSSSSLSYTFQVEPESEGQIANLDFLTACRCLNVREVHYWLYCSLRKVEQALRAGQIIDENWWNNNEEVWNKADPMILYCQENNLWPLLNNTSHDHIDELLKKCTEIGAYFFSPDEKHIHKSNPTSVYCFPSKNELASFFDSNPSSTWCTDNECDETGEVRLAIDTTLMEKEIDFEQAFPSERLRNDIPIATNQDQQTLINQDRVFKDDLKMTADIIGCVGIGGVVGVELGSSLAELRLAIPEEFHTIAGIFKRLYCFIWEHIIGQESVIGEPVTFEQVLFGVPE